MVKKLECGWKECEQIVSHWPMSIRTLVLPGLGPAPPLPSSDGHMNVLPAKQVTGSCPKHQLPYFLGL